MSKYQVSFLCLHLSDWRYLRFSLFVALLVAPSAVFAQPAVQCSADGATYLRLAQQSIAQLKLEQASQRISRASAEGCYSAELELQLGETFQEQGDNSAAAAQFEQAQAHATSTNTQALAIARYAQSLAADVGPNPESLDLLQFARRAHSDPPEWMNALALQIDTQLLDAPFERERVTRSFSSNRMGRMTMANINPIQASTDQPSTGRPSVSQTSSPSGGGGNAGPRGGVAQSLSFRTHFERGSSDLEEAERAKVVELAEALASAELQQKRFRLVGHTDSTGSAGINQSLSVQRARTVYTLVVAARPELASRITFDGKGASELLYSNATSAIEHRLNRRVQVVLE